MDKKAREELAETLSTVLDQHRGVDSETHDRHHEYIETSIKRQNDALIFWSSVRKQVFGWSIIVMLSGVGLAVADWVQHILKINHGGS